MFSDANQHIKDVVWASFKKLLVPFVIFSCVGHFVYCIIVCCNHELTLQSALVTPVGHLLKFGSVHGNKPLWFLVTLFIVRTLYQPFIARDITKYIIVVISAILIYILYYYKPDIPLYLYNGVLGLFFLFRGIDFTHSSI